MAPTVMRMPKQPSREIVSEALEARIRMATIIELMVSIDESLEVVMADAAHTKTWPDLAIGLYDRLTGRNAEITYEFDNMSIKIPSGTGPSAEQAEWAFSGTLRVRTQDLNAGSSPKS